MTRRRCARAVGGLLPVVAVMLAFSCGDGRPANERPPAAARPGSAELAVVLPDRDALAFVDPRRGITGEVAVGASPWGVAVAGGRAYVTAARHVAVVDVRRRRLVARVPYRTSVPRVERGEYRRGGMGLAVLPGGRRVAVGVHTGGRGRVELLRTDRLEMSGMARVGVRPFDVLAGRGGRSAFSIDHDSYGVTAVNVHTLRTRAYRVAPLGDGAFDKLNYGAVDRRGRLLLPINGEILAVLDPRTGRVRTQRLRARVHQAGVALTRGRLVTVGAEALGGERGPNLSVLDLRSGRERLIRLRRPHEDVAVSRDGRTAYLTGGYTRGGWEGLTIVPLDGGPPAEVPLPAAPLGIAVLGG